MRLVETIDVDGYKHLAWCKDNDNSTGICADPPFLGQLDWPEIEKEIHNQLVDRRLTNWQEVQRQQNSISNIIQSVLKRKIVQLYRIAEKGE